MAMSEFPALPQALPWQGGAYLFLDGVSVPDILGKLYTWYPDPDIEILYLKTRLAGLHDISPCLIRLNSPYEAAMQAYFENLGDEWGYLIFSHADKTTLIQHLRWLLTVKHPLGNTVFLRHADPAVANALFADAVSRCDLRFFGVIELVVMFDPVTRLWNQHQRPSEALAPVYDKPYALSEAQMELLSEVSFRNVLINLDKHLHAHFPAYCTALTRIERWQHLRGLADEAYERGFNSERDIFRYANIFALLGDDALQHHSDIAELITSSSAATPSQRVEQAARIAYERTQQRGDQA
nr:DUF4123 domain-containing protein [Pseudomonas sp. J237]